MVGPYRRPHDARCTASRAPCGDRSTLAAAALLLMIVLASVAPLPDTMFDGVDGSGRPYGGSSPSTLSFGPLAAGLGKAVVLAATAGVARPRSRP